MSERPVFWLDWKTTGELFLASSPRLLLEAVVGYPYAWMTEEQALARRREWLCEIANVVQEAVVQEAEQDGRMAEATSQELRMLRRHKSLPPPNRSVEWWLPVPLVVVAPDADIHWSEPDGPGMVVVSPRTDFELLASVRRMGIAEYGDLTESAPK